MSQPEPIRDHDYCDLCSRSDGLLIEVVSPPYPGDRRRERFRTHHAGCVAERRAAEAAAVAEMFARRREAREANDA